MADLSSIETTAMNRSLNRYNMEVVNESYEKDNKKLCKNFRLRWTTLVCTGLLICMGCSAATWYIVRQYYENKKTVQYESVAAALKSDAQSHTGDSSQLVPIIDPLLGENNDNVNGVNIIWEKDTPPPWGGPRLPGTLIPSLYNISLRIDMDDFNFTGSVCIYFKCVEETSYIVLHVYKLTIPPNSVSIQKESTNHMIQVKNVFEVNTNNFYVICLEEPLRQDATYTLKIGPYNGDVQQDNLFGLYKSSYKKPTGEVSHVAITQLQAVDSRAVFPCFDEPAYKARFVITIEHRPNYNALSNMQADCTETLADGWVRQTFPPTPIMSTYLVALSLNDYSYTSKKEVDGPEIRIWAPLELINQTMYALNLAANIYKFYEDFFDMEKHLAHVEHILTPDLAFEAMENWGLVTHQPPALLIDDKISSDEHKFYVGKVMSHEIAHAWFGNTVTLEWWSDLWLHEAFANLVMYMCLENIHPEWKAFDKQIVHHNMATTLVQDPDALLSSHPIYFEFKTPDEINQYFDMITYVKGSHILRMVQHLIGTSLFRKGIRNFLKSYQYNNVKTADLWQTLTDTVTEDENVTKRSVNEHDLNVGDMMDTWLKQMGYPVIFVDKVDNTTLVINQEHFLLNPNDLPDYSDNPYKYKWDVPFSYETSNDLPANIIFLRKEMQSISFTEQITDDFWIVGNINSDGYYLVNYWKENWEQLIRVLKASPHKIGESTRLAILNSAFMLAKGTRIDYSLLFNLCDYLINETSLMPWKTFLFHTEYISMMLAKSHYHSDFNTYMKSMISPILNKLGWEENGNDAYQTKELRITLLNAALKYGHTEIQQFAYEKYKTWKKGGEISVNFRQLVYKAAVMEGTTRDWEYVYEYAQKSIVPGDRFTAYGALATAKQPWLLQRFLNLVLNGTFASYDISKAAESLNQTPLSRFITYCFMTSHWEVIYNRHKMNPLAMDTILPALVSGITTTEEVDTIERLFRDYPPIDSTKNPIEKARHTARINVFWSLKHTEPLGTLLRQRNRNMKLDDQHID